MMSDKLSVGNEMLQFDQKNTKFYDSLTDEEKKKFSPYLMIRYGSTVEGDFDLQAYYLISCNEKLNKNFFDINTTQHKKFQWLMATTVSPGMGRQRHTWLAAKKKDSSNNKAEKFLREFYPLAKDDEIELLAKINDKDDLKRLAREHGWDDKRIKDYL
jgi:hypothetical protein